MGRGPGRGRPGGGRARTRRTARWRASTTTRRRPSDLLAKDRAYPCYCTPEELDADRKAQEAAKQPARYVGRCAALTPDERAASEAEGRRGALRFRVRPGVVGWNDLVRDRVEIDTANLGGDFVIVRADGNPLYHFTVVVDDTAMEISHVIRGEDHVSNTPKHILLFEALGYPLPVFGHLPLILNPDGTKMSKRKSQTAVADYVAQGFLREALVNYFAFLGWSPGTEEDVLSLDEIVERFELDKVHKGGARFDRERLEWLNGQWIRRLDDEDLVERLMPFLEAAQRRRPDRPPARRPRTSPVAAADRARAPADARGHRGRGRLPVDRRPRGRTRRPIVPKRWDAATTRDGLAAARELLAAHDAVTWEADELEPPLRALAEARGWKAGDLFMAIRVAATGQDRHAAAVRHARRPRPRPDAGPPGRGASAAWARPA